MTPEQASDTYTILIEECGAPDAGQERVSFINYMTGLRGTKEWRFQGRLGFGGKCRVNDNHPFPHVAYYPEHETDARNAMVGKANARIRELFAGATS